MLFNSLTYLLFLPVVYLLYRLLRHRQQNILLLLASYVFYAWWDVRFLALIVISTAVNYCCGIVIRKGELSRNERIIPSAWVVVTSFFSLVIPWSRIREIRKIAAINPDWGALMPQKEALSFFLMICVIVALCNVLYTKVLLLDENKKRKFYIIFGLLANLVILGIFKYYNFFIDNVAWLLKAVSLDPARFYLNILLPVGISFFTFKGIGYVIDVYRGEVEPERRYTDFALFLAFFPALLAGPIDRAGSLLKQISSVRTLTMEKTWRGLHLIFYGLFKKVVIADGVVKTVNSVFGSTGHASWIDVVAATVLFTIQIYCDFSGYTDMARGTAKLFGIDLMVNFNLPYFSKTPREFWSRWHISLSTWLRDYLYIPLGGNRLGTAKTYRNLILTMVLGGLWHGAAWNFALWGLYHGLVLSAHRAINSIRAVVEIRQNMVAEGLKIALFFVITCYGWLLFRAPTLEKIVNLSSTLILDFGNMNFGAARPRAAALFGLPVLLCIEVIEYASNSKSFYLRLPIPAWTALYATMIFCFIVGMTNESSQFIYFTF